MRGILSKKVMTSFQSFLVNALGAKPGILWLVIALGAGKDNIAFPCHMRIWGGFRLLR